MKIRLTFTALVLAALVPAFALAGMPKPKDPQINPPLEIAGVELGMKLAKANKQWGGKGDCVDEKGFEACSWGDIGKRGYAEIIGRDGEVFVVSITLPFSKNGERAKFKGPLRDMISMEGIGLGSTMKDVKAAYPDAKRLPGRTGYLLKEDGTKMTFTGLGSRKQRKVTSILLFQKLPE